MGELFVICSCIDHCNMVRGPDYVEGTPCIHGASVVVAMSRLAVAQMGQVGDQSAPDAWTTVGPSLRSLRAAALRKRSEAEKAKGGTSAPELGTTIGPSRPKTRAAASKSRSQSVSRARSGNEHLPYACGRCGFESKVELTECEGKCGRSCCGRCTAEQLARKARLCFCAAAADQPCPSARRRCPLETLRTWALPKAEFQCCGTNCNT